MKRIRVRPGKLITLSDEVFAKTAQTVAAARISRQDAERTILREPRHTSVYCGPTHSTSTPRSRKGQRIWHSKLQRVALKVREMLDAAQTHASQGDIDRWVEQWLSTPLAALDGSTPSEVLDADDGWPRIVVELERMSGGLPA